MYMYIYMMLHTCIHIYEYLQGTVYPQYIMCVCLFSLFSSQDASGASESQFYRRRRRRRHRYFHHRLLFTVRLFTAGLFTAYLFTAHLFTARLFTARLFTARLFTARLFTARLFTARLFTARPPCPARRYKYRRVAWAVARLGRDAISGRAVLLPVLDGI